MALYTMYLYCSEGGCGNIWNASRATGKDQTIASAVEKGGWNTIGEDAYCPIHGSKASAPNKNDDLTKQIDKRINHFADLLRQEFANYQYSVSCTAIRDAASKLN